MANNAPEGWKGGNHLKIYDLSDPAKPVYIRDFGLLGQQPGATSHEGVRAATGIHGPISAGVAKNRVYAAYGTGANGVIQILDRQKLLTAFKNPMKPTTEEMLAPQVGFIAMSPDQGAHTALPVFGVPIPEFQGHTALKKRDILIVASEQGRGDRCNPGPNGDRPAPHLAFLLDITNEAAPWPISTFRVPENPGDFCGKGGRFGAHAGTESFYPPTTGSWRSSPGSTRARASSIFATPLPCRRSPISFLRRTRTRWRSARMESAIQPAIPRSRRL